MRSGRREICVIGAGIVGAAVAFHLSAAEGVQISIVDAGHPGAGTTDAGTGWITARGTKNASYRQLRLLAMEEHHRLAGLFSPCEWLNPGGTLQTEDAAGSFDELLDDCRSTGFPIEVLSAAEVNENLEPNIAFERPDMRVAHFPSEFTVAGALLTRTLVDRAIENGAIGHFGSRVIGLEQLPGLRHRVVFDDGTSLDADAVVNAAGAKADDIAAMYEVAMPMRPQPGVGVRARVDGSPLTRMIISRTLTAKPETKGVIRLRSMLGWSTGAGLAERNGSFTGGMERNAFIASVIDDAKRLLPTTQIEPIGAFSGVRPIPADGLPRIGQVGSVPGYYEIVMHSAAVLAPLVGRLLAQEIVTGEASPLLEPFRPSRFCGDGSHGGPSLPASGLAQETETKPSFVESSLG